MRTNILKLATIAFAALSILWLIGYVRALRPFAADYLRDRDFTFLRFPVIKVYRITDPFTGKLSPCRVDFFSISDGPTGVEYNESYFPCWVISIGAVAGLFGGGYALLCRDRKT